MGSWWMQFSLQENASNLGRCLCKTVQFKGPVHTGPDLVWSWMGLKLGIPFRWLRNPEPDARVLMWWVSFDQNLSDQI